MESNSAPPNTMKSGFPIQVWLLTNLLPAAGGVVVMAILNDLEWGLLCGGIAYVISSLLSLPALFLSLKWYRQLAESNLETALAKRQIRILGIKMVAVTLLVASLFRGYVAPGMYVMFAVVYGGSMALAVAYCPLREAGKITGESIFPQS